MSDAEDVNSLWIPLNVHSQFSILDSTASVQALAERAKMFGIPALALSDQGNLYGAVDFFKACKGSGVKPIIGCEIWVAPVSRLEKKRTPGVPSGYPIVLICKDMIGYRNLCKLSSFGFLEGFYYQPRIDKELLAAHREGLICLSGPFNGSVASMIAAGQEKELRAELLWYQQLFGEDYYFELQRHKMSEEQIREDGIDQEQWLLQKVCDGAAVQEKVNGVLLELSREMHIPVVATNDIHYIEREDWQAHEILLNIQSGEPCEIWERDSRGVAKSRMLNPKRETLLTHELYFKSPAQMRELFADAPQAISETVRIAEKCTLELDFKTRHYPVFIPPGLNESNCTKAERLKAAERYLYDLCLQGIEKRYTPERLARVQKKIPDKDPRRVVRERFDYEFDILTSKGMSDYMLIVYDFIDWAKRRGIPMGPGRGSAAGSIIAYLIGITDIEPLCFHLIFERFINPERVSYPDIDVDICMDRRQEVIDYTIQKYGKEKVAQIITFGTMKAKMAIRDVGRVLNVPLSKVNDIAKLVPEDPTMTLEKAFQMEPELGRLVASDDEARRVLEMAKKCEGSIRNTSTHAAGLIISASPITDHIPVCTAKDSHMIVTQFAMKPVESVGMLKIDFLGLKTLTSIHKCIESIVVNTGRRIDWSNLPLDDKASFELLNQGKTLGVFQLESGGMQDLAKQLHIDTFEEIIAVGALYRPGPMDMIPSFINRKHGREAIDIDHPLMKSVLEETYGVMVYQEQVMQIASHLAGYSLAEGDVLRRAMGKKDKEEMARQREKFLFGCAKKGIGPDVGQIIFDKIEKFASYGFNKSHAAAYAYLSYTTAYLKANFPKEWLASLMTCDRDDLSKVAKFIREANAMQIPMLPPDVNEAGSEFTATSKGIRFAMTGIKGVGSHVVDLIIEERKKGLFANLYEFVQRMDKTKVGKKQIELLVDAGCFDFTAWSRDAMRQSLDAMYEEAFRDQRDESRGVMNLFSLLEKPANRFQTPPPVPLPTSKMQMLQREKELLGFYLTGHPMDNYRQQMSRLSCVPFREFENMPDGAIVRAAFVVETVQVKISAKSQRKFAILIIGDGIERFELPVWSDLYEEKGALLRENQLLYGILQIERQEGVLRLQGRFLEDLTTVDEAKVQACGDLYDRLKVPKYQGKPKDSQRKNMKTPVIEAPVPLLRIRADADRIRLSHILALKKLFRECPGKSRIEIIFNHSNSAVGAVHIDASWGVALDRPFKDKLQEMAKAAPIAWEFV
ncbi:MAG: dnaE [Parachlamydiales bacterium]|nr:dnaE [Parachlamydiales bacterium]